MTVTIYHNPRCSKSRAALTLLHGRGIEPRVVEYLKTPPDEGALRQILAMLRLRPRQLLRPAEAKAAGLDDPALDDDALIRGMLAHPSVIERPIVVAGDRACVGRPPERVLELLDDTDN
ncbi:MAG TPA: arsenate reductase (glutaredoxin) [Rhodospirillales bacterium]|nr:arsenate reductase (glutaredoxin) [Rhodospirillales bacterium]